MNNAQNLTLSADLAKRIAESLADFEDGGLVSDTIEGETDFYECVDAMLEANAEDEASAAGVDVVIEKLKGRKDAALERVRKRKALLADALNHVGIKTAKRPLGTVTVKAVAPKAVVYNEDQVPGKFMVVKTSRRPDMKAINEALKSGEQVSGARLDNGGQALQVRT